MNHKTISAEETRGKIIAEATKLFHASSYDSTSVNDIINAAGISKGGFYYHFADKESLFFEIHVASLTNFLNIIKAINDRKDLTPPQKIAELIKGMLDYLVQDDEAKKYNTYVRELECLTPEHQKHSVDLRREFLYIIRDIITEGIQTGDFKPSSDPTSVAFAIIGMCMWTTNWLFPSRSKTTQQVADTFTDLVLSGLKA